jgi:hypothetical protein
MSELNDLRDDEFFGQAFIIRAKHSGKVLDIFGKSQSDQAIVQQFKDNGGAHQRFCLFRLDDSTYIIAARHSGKVFDVISASTSSRANIIQFRFHGGENQRFEVETKGAHRLIRAKHSGKVLDVQGASKSDQAIVQQFEEHGKDNQLFEFIPAEPLNVPPPSTTGVVGDIPRFTSIEQTLEDSDPVLVAEMLYPYFLVEDTLPHSARIQQTPYYIMRKSQFWKKVYQEEFPAGQGVKQTSSYSVGMKQSESQQMEKTVNFTIGADFGLLFGEKMKGLLTLNVLRGLKTTKSISNETSTTKTRADEVTFTTGSGLVLAKFALANVYSIHRADGVLVKGPWQVIDDRETRTDRFPDDPQAELSFKTLVLD